MRIKKIAPVTPANGNIENSYGTSQTDTYSQEYQNEHNVVVSPTTPTTNERVWFKHNIKNLLNFNTISATITNTGDYTYSNARLAFDYIPMEANKQIIFSCNIITSFMGIAYYDSNKQYISRDTNNSQSNISVTTPTNTKYVRPFINIADNIPINNSSINQYEMQLEYGNIRTTFETLVNPSINVNGEEIYNQNVMNYSTEEQIIGKWIDGKPIYRKVIDISNITSSNSNLVDLTSLNVKQMIKIGGIAKYDNNTFPIPLTDSSTNYNVLFYNGQFLRGRLVMGTGGNLQNAYAIIEYTKTTD